MSDQLHSKVLIIGSGPAGLYRRRSMPRAPIWRPADSGASAGWSIDDHDRCRELSRLCRRDPGPMADGTDGGAPGQAHVSGVELEPHDLITSVDLGVTPASARWAIPATPTPADTLIIATEAPGAVDGPAQRAAFSRLSAFRPAPPATGSSIAARKWRSSAAAIPPSRKYCSLTIPPQGDASPSPRYAAG